MGSKQLADNFSMLIGANYLVLTEPVCCRNI